MSWTVVNADQLSNYYKQQQTAQNPYAAYYNQYNHQAANSQTPQIIQLPANPWDSNPPLGTTPNLVWPQNTTPFQTQGGAPPWPNYNQQSLVPQYMAGHGQPGNQPHCQPQAGAQVHTNFNLDIPGKNNNNIDSNKNNSNLNKSGNSMTTCPCCGNMTYRQNIKPGYMNSEINTSSAPNTSSVMNYNPSQGNQSHPGGKPCPVHGYTNGLMSGSQQKSQHQNNYSQYYQDQMKAYQQSMMDSMMNATNNATRAALPPNAGSQSADQTRQTSQPPSHHTSHNHQLQGGVSGSSESAPLTSSARDPGAAGRENQGNTIMNAYQQSLENWKKAQQLHHNVRNWQNMQHQLRYQPEMQRLQGGKHRQDDVRRKHHNDLHSQASTVSSRRDTDANSFTSL